MRQMAQRWHVKDMENCDFEGIEDWGSIGLCRRYLEIMGMAFVGIDAMGFKIDKH